MSLNPTYWTLDGSYYARLLYLKLFLVEKLTTQVLLGRDIVRLVLRYKIYLCHAIVQVDGRGLRLCHASQGLVL